MMEKPKIYTVFFGKPAQKQGWPYQGFDCQARKEKLLRRLKQECPQLEFKGGHLVTTSEPEINTEQVENIRRERKPACGCLYYLLALPPFQISRPVLEGKPAILANDLFGGDLTFLSSFDVVKKENLPIIPVSSSSLEDVKQNLKLFTVISRLQGSKALMLENVKKQRDQAHKWKEDRERYFKLAQEKLGVEIKLKNLQELLDIYQCLPRNQAQKIANKWMKAAEKTVEPAPEEVLKSGKMYLAIKKLLEQEQASAFTMDCLNLFYQDASPTLPCLAYSQLLNEGLKQGLVGTCEADLDSLLSQLIGEYLTGRPGFISDPVLDLGRNQIIYAHCVAPTKVRGEQKKACPCRIRSHSESNQSAALQVFYPQGEPITTIKLNLLQQKMALHQGQIVGNPNQRKGCRTKVAAQAKVDNILNNWDYQTFGWHRVSFCGDFREEVKKIATLLDLELIEEDK